MNQNPKVSILVPTRNRHDTLFHCLRTLIDQDYDNLEIIVSDNCSTPETRSVVESFNSPRIRYIRTPQPCSMSHNFEFGLSHVTGEWVAVVGDDDGLLPGGIRRALTLANDAGVKAVGSRAITYNWPSVREGVAPSLEIPWSRKQRVVDSKSALANVLQGREDYRTLPLLYTGGLIHKSVLTAMRPDGGSIIRSQIPDVYSGFAIASVVDHFAFSDKPWAVGGRSSHSNGLATLLKFKGKDKAFHTPDLIPFHPDVPLPDVGTFVFSLEAMQYESFLQTAFLHRNMLGITPEDQLKVIMAKCQPDHIILLEAWVPRFCQLHAITPDAFHDFSKARDPRIRFQISVNKLRYFLRYYRSFDQSQIEIPDVCEATIEAQRLMNSRPSILKSHIEFARRIIARKLARNTIE